MIKKLIVFILFSTLFVSCASSKKIHYLQGAAGQAESTATEYQSTLQPDDNLLITVTAEEPALANDFNLMYINARSTEMRTMVNNDAFYTYLIDQNGEIDFPKFGKIKLAGLTRIEAENKIKDLLKKEIINPGVILRIVNFKVSVAGEVVRPGSFPVTGERVTILEAVSMAGDLTIYGDRKQVTVVREKDGAKIIAEVDLTDANLVNSPYYYLAHNDWVYVKQNKTRVNSSVVGPNLTVAISALSLLVTIIALSTR